MDSVLLSLNSLLLSFGKTEYIVVGVVIFVIFLLIQFYLPFNAKKKLCVSINQNINVFQKAFDLTDDAVLILSEKNRIIFANKSMTSLLGLGIGYKLEVLRKIPKIMIKNEWIPLDKYIEKNDDRISKNTLSVPQVLFASNDKQLMVNLHLDRVDMDNTQNEWYSIITLQDLTQMQIADEQQFRHKLTNMPNQIQAIRDFPALFSKIHTQNNKIALVLLSFDNFSRLRSIIGYEQSNEVLIKFSKYLQTISNDMNMSVYHTFDNHFLMSISNVDSVDSVTLLIGEIQTRLAEFYKMKDVSLHLTVSAGVSVYPDSGPTRKLLDNTYKALAQAQKEGDSKISMYQKEKSKEDFDELTLHNDMQKGLDKGEFEVYYQPIVETNKEKTVGAEALIRWIHPKLGFIPPDVFIGLMEKTGFIIKLGQYVLAEVLKQQKRWELFKFKKIQVSINVSMVEIATGEFVEHVKEQIAYHQGNPELLKFEITEGIAMISEKQTEKYFHRLKKLGVGISLDDFGTGYTSFTYLKKFPADILKIDKSLVDHILTSEEDQRIVKAMIDLGHNLGMKIVVEGIETRKMVDLVTSYGCDYIQGYYFSKPLPVFEFQKLLR